MCTQQVVLTIHHTQHNAGCVKHTFLCIPNGKNVGNFGECQEEVDRYVRTYVQGETPQCVM